MGTVFAALVGGFGVVLLVAAAFVVAGATAARLVARRRSLGLLRRRRVPPAPALPRGLGRAPRARGSSACTSAGCWAPSLAPAFQAGLDDVLAGRAHPPRPAVAARGRRARRSPSSPSASSCRPSGPCADAPTEALQDVPPSASGVGPRRTGPSSSGPGRRRPGGRAPDLRPSGPCGPGGGRAGGRRRRDVVSRRVHRRPCPTSAADPAVTGNPWDVAVDPRTRLGRRDRGRPERHGGVDRWFTEDETAGTVAGVGYTVRLMGGDPAAAGTSCRRAAPCGRPTRPSWATPCSRRPASTSATRSR